ncbi:MAG: zinc ribbon domain-containing protein [Lentisphaerae bacterium]|nr:zinc ribbon domain-containing protein [Lentisphaerota bacterium]MBQ4329536.1 zinc ribbon domain-containing protein [Lentisphaeria bacterium]
MPIFRYHCQDCDAEFELLLARFDSPAECPECGSEKLEKQPNRIAAITSKNSGCAMQNSCPAAGAHCCSGSCGCGKH